MLEMPRDVMSAAIATTTTSKPMVMPTINSISVAPCWCCRKRSTGLIGDIVIGRAFALNIATDGWFCFMGLHSVWAVQGTAACRPRRTTLGGLDVLQMTNEADGATHGRSGSILPSTYGVLQKFFQGRSVSDGSLCRLGCIGSRSNQ